MQIKGKLEYHFSSEKKELLLLGSELVPWLKFLMFCYQLEGVTLQETDQSRLELPSSAYCGTAELLEFRGKSKAAACCMYAFRYFLLLLLGIAAGVVVLCKAIKVNFAPLQQMILI